MTDHQPSDHVLVSPRYLAGQGDPGTVLRPLVHVHEFQHQQDDVRLTATSQCGQVQVAFEPNMPYLWRVSVRRDPAEERPHWQAHFSLYTPAELIAALTQALAADLYTRRADLTIERTASPTTAWRPLAKASWHLSEADDTTTLVSPERRLAFRHSFTPPGQKTSPGCDSDVWDAECDFGMYMSERWRGRFSQNTPMRYLHLFTANLASPTPVPRARAELPAASLPLVTLRPANPRSGMRPFSAVELAGAMFNPRHPTHGNLSHH
ncbi:DUF317 domain-containing protein [Kitasatospora sp. NPDC004669]|uniref:DUF317 domain-containing protein n=1 Tax=Kitasatospora sp. NPDC004669 TaxID=3154555 RepID=UPI0033BD4743